MKYNKIILAIVILVLLSVSVIAVPPTTQILTGDNGIEIVYPKLDYYDVDKDVKFHFHAYNLSNGFWFQDGSLTCNLHLYDNGGGHHRVINNMDYDAGKGDYEYILPKNETVVGIMGYAVYCNNTEYGFESGAIIINHNGHEPVNTSYPIAIIGIILALFCINYFINPDEHFVIKLLIYFTQILLSSTLSFFAFENSMGSGGISVYKTTTIFMYLFLLYVVTYFFWHIGKLVMDMVRKRQ